MKTNYRRRIARKVLNLENYKSLLRVRGLGELTDIEKIETELLSLVQEVEVWRNQIKEFAFVYKIVNTTQNINIAGYTQKYERVLFNIPKLCWAQSIKVPGKKTARKIITEWEFISDALDRANASLDERQIHIHTFMLMHWFNSRGRVLRERLLQETHKQKQLDSLLSTEGLKLSQLPNYLLYKEEC